ncbi:MAG: DNA polymerase III subunit delta [Prevotella sp.]|nr:DNA polymerase III subunit delta [Prevotella sp.]
MGFNDIIGQQEISERLLQMAREDRVPHALMLCGPVGSGKKALAIALACELIKRSTARPAADSSMLSMFGDEPAAQEPVPDANTLVMLAKLEHPDLHFTFPTIKTASMGAEHQPTSSDFAREWHELLSTAGPYFSLNDWMEAIGAANQQAIITAGESDELARKLSLKSSQGGYKVSIIWLPERMNLTSANKLLKLLEEPPRQTVFIMVSEAPEQLLDTIRSRTQRIDVRPIDAADIEEALVSRRAVEPDMAHRVARVANGSWLRAIETLNADNENRQFLDMFVMLMRLAYQRNVRDLKAWTDNVCAYGREKQRRMLSYFVGQVRENFIYNFHNPELNYQTQEEENFSRNFARFINEANVMPITELFERAMRDIGQNANGKIVFFDMALQMIVLLLRK